MKAFLEKNNIVTFLNLEIRLSNINKEDQLGDYHIIFNNKLDNQVVKNLLAELKANLGSCEKSFNRLEKKDIEESANISIESLHDILKKNAELKGQYLTGFLSRGHGSSSSDSDPKNKAVYEQTTIKTDFVIHSSCNDPLNCKDPKCKHNNLNRDRKFWLNISPYVRPLLQSSDAHSFEEIGKKYSWIKSDKTFEGLKQILFEPEARVCLEKERPQLEKDELVIDKLVIEDKEIYLSENLNAIIGGRSTGKSTLLNSIAKKLNNDVKESFVFNDLDNFKVYWRDQMENNTRKIEYIPQEYMFKLAKEESELNDLVKKIIKAKKLDQKLEDYINDCEQIKSKIDDLLKRYFSYHNQLDNLEKPEAEKNKTLDRIKEYQEKYDELLSTSSFKSEDREVFQKLLTEKDNNEKNKIDSKKQKILISALKIQEVTLSNDNRIELNVDLSKKITNLLKDINMTVKKIYDKKIEEIIETLDESIQINRQRIKEIDSNEIFKEGVAISDTNRYLSKLDMQIKQEKEILSQIKEYERQKLLIETNIKNTKENIINLYQKYKELRERLEFEFKITQIDLEIKLEFQQKDLYQEFRYINGQGNSKDNFISRLQNNFDEEIYKIFDNINEVRFNENKNNDDLVSHFFSTNFYEHSFKIIYQEDEFQMMSPGKKSFVILKLILEFSDSKIPVLIDQPEDSLDNRAIYSELTKYIKSTKLQRQIIIVTHNPNVVVGSDCENIIVANQHSDNSRNKHDKKFDYINGSLENTFKENLPYTLERQGIREHIFEILEGGQEAFEKREKKYNLSMIR